MNLSQISKIKQILFYSLVFCIFLVRFTAVSQHKSFTVVLDAGHGGKDPGKVGYRKYKEKDIALQIVLQVGNNLSKEKGIKVIYTRKKDVFVDLFERGRIANKADANLFVSVHCNAHKSQASGSETWVLGVHANKRNFEVAKAENEVILLEENFEEKYEGFDPNSPESVIGLTLEQEEYLDKSLELASAVQQNFKGKLRRHDRGVKQAGFIVLHQTYMPSILIETGFLTNKKEAAYLHSKKGKAEMAAAISKAILTYVNNLRINTVAKEKRSTVEHASANKEKVYFKVQIASGTTKLETYSYNFKGLKNVERVKVGSNFKYYFGKSTSYSKVKAHLKLVQKKGYRSAFIAAFVNEVKVPLAKALKKSN
jgi:N-acetylmuramoyl-L-alanine amidase